MDELKFKPASEPKDELRIFNSSTFKANTITFTNESKEVMKLCENGDIYVKGKLIENDKEVVDGMRELLTKTGTINKSNNITEELAEQFLVWAENGWNLKGAYDDNQKEGQESSSWQVVRPYFKRKLMELFG